MRKSKKQENVDYVHDMLAGLDHRLDEMTVLLAKQQQSLEYHIKRTDLLQEEIKPIRKHVYMVQGVGAFLGILALIATIYAAVK